MNIEVVLESMSFYSSHGCYDTEQLVGGRFEVEMRYCYDCSGVVSSDDVSDAVSYLDVYALIREEMGIASHTLEHVASRVCGRMLREFLEVESVGVTIRKVTPPLGGDIKGVSVTLSVSR
ncbi:MAG: dihydroneopterin aldolase [Rikenellaceae bacterium]